MYASNATDTFIIIMAIGFITAIPGLWPLVLWIRRSSGDPAKILAERPTLPWWARGFIGQFLAFLALNFWIGFVIGLLLGFGSALFDFDISERMLRSIKYGVLGASVALAIQLYQRAAAIAFPPHFSGPEKKALKKLKQTSTDPATAIADYQSELARDIQGPMPLTLEGVNFYDPESPQSPLAQISWNQVICLPQAFTNKYLVLYLDENMPAPPALRQVAHGRKPNYYRLYFNSGNSRAAGLKMQALAKHLWTQSHQSSLGELTDPVARRAVNYFD